MLNYPLAEYSWNNEEIEAINETVKSGKFTMGEKVKSFEKSFASKVGRDYAVMVNSGSSANLLAVAACVERRFLSPGDEVIVPCVGWSTTYFPLYQYGLKLIFCDIDDTFNINVNLIKECISPKTKAICVVNVLGNPCDFDRIYKICKDYNLLLLEDNCEGLGGFYKNKQLGTFGHTSTFSFFFSHHLQTMEGGVIVTNNEETYHYLLSLRAHGWLRELPEINFLHNKENDAFEDSFKFVVPGYNLRPTEIQGAVGLVQLRKWDKFINNRFYNGGFFEGYSKKYNWCKPQKTHHLSSYFGLGLLLEDGIDRKRIANYLIENGVECRPVITGDFTKQPVIKKLPHEVISNEFASKLHNQGLFIGNSNFIISEKIQYALDKINEAI